MDLNFPVQFSLKFFDINIFPLAFLPAKAVLRKLCELVPNLSILGEMYDHIYGLEQYSFNREHSLLRCDGL